MALPIFTARHQATIVGVSELNFCVRDGNRWTLTTINTNCGWLLTNQLRYNTTTIFICQLLFFRIFKNSFPYQLAFISPTPLTRLKAVMLVGRFLAISMRVAVEKIMKGATPC